MNRAALRETTDTDAGKAVAVAPKDEGEPVERKPVPKDEGATTTYRGPVPATGSGAREFDEYLLLGKLGERGVGVVYKAHTSSRRIGSLIEQLGFDFQPSGSRIYRESEACLERPGCGIEDSLGLCRANPQFLNDV